MAYIQCLDDPNAPDPTDGFERMYLMDVCWRSAAPAPDAPGALPPPSPGDRLIWGRYFSFLSL